MKYQDLFTAGKFYHVFNRANSPQDKLFYQEKNYAFFLKKWHDYLGDVFDVWSYCLIPNHYHFLVWVKESNHNKIIERIRRFSISYTQAINKQEKRRGSLFQEHPKRVMIKREAHLLWLVYYIHNNPVHHEVSSEILHWKYSSLQALSGTMPTKLARQDVLDIFGSRENFLHFHQQELHYDDIGYCLLDGNEG
jgi:REP element-mobilizing transposase RayT